MSNDLPSLSSVLSLLMHEDSRRKAMGLNHEHIGEISDENNGVFAAGWKNKNNMNFSRRNFPVNNGEKKTIICSYCKKSGHHRDKCWSLQGNPDRFMTSEKYSAESKENDRQTGEKRFGFS
ncbi:hypothetical protein QML37_31520, partial [Klebsiella pneumoniae]|uniref:hypothetical protein n=1 Tax=Klebsiella pneumoniae TaxID=573 RepID=UPI003A804C62